MFNYMFCLVRYTLWLFRYTLWLFGYILRPSPQGPSLAAPPGKIWRKTSVHLAQRLAQSVCRKVCRKECRKVCRKECRKVCRKKCAAKNVPQNCIQNHPYCSQMGRPRGPDWAPRGPLLRRLGSRFGPMV
jgi:hypothetical protein